MASRSVRVLLAAVVLVTVVWLATTPFVSHRRVLRENDTDVGAALLRVKHALSKPLVDYGRRMQRVRALQSCDHLRAAFKANTLGVQGVTVADAYNFRTSCGSPICLRSESCTASPVKRITADGVIVRHNRKSACCQDLLELLAVRMLGVFAEFDFTAYPAAGTLLSAIRDGGVNPWTVSIDDACVWRAS